MDKHTEFLLDRIFEIREDYKSGDLGSKDIYDNIAGTLITALAHYTIEVVDNCYNVEENSLIVEKRVTA